MDSNLLYVKFDLGEHNMMNKHGTKWRPHAHAHKSHETKRTRHQSQSDANCSPQSELIYNFGNAPSLLLTLTLTQSLPTPTWVERATQLIFGSAPARRKSRDDCFFVTLGIDCQICARRYRRMHG